MADNLKKIVKSDSCIIHFSNDFSLKNYIKANTLIELSAELTTKEKRWFINILFNR